MRSRLYLYEEREMMQRSDTVVCLARSGRAENHAWTGRSFQKTEGLNIAMNGDLVLRAPGIRQGRASRIFSS